MKLTLGQETARATNQKGSLETRRRGGGLEFGDGSGPRWSEVVDLGLQRIEFTTLGEFVFQYSTQSASRARGEEYGGEKLKRRAGGIRAETPSS